MRLIIDIPKETYEFINVYEFMDDDYIGKLAGAIANGTPIPDNATNGDVVKAMFGKEFADKCIDYCNAHMVGGDWWNAPYQKGGK